MCQMVTQYRDVLTLSTERQIVICNIIGSEFKLHLIYTNVSLWNYYTDILIYIAGKLSSKKLLPWYIRTVGTGLSL